MKRILFATVVFVGYFALSNFALGADDENSGPIVFDKTYDVMVADFEDHVIETENFVINNVLLARVRSDYGDDKKMERLTFGASIRGRSSKSQEVSVMLAGFDEKKALLWTSKAVDSMYGKAVGSMGDQIRVPQGTLKNTASIWMRVVVVTNRN